MGCIVHVSQSVTSLGRAKQRDYPSWGPAASRDLHGQDHDRGTAWGQRCDGTAQILYTINAIC